MSPLTRSLTRSALGVCAGFICLLLMSVAPSGALALLCVSSLGVVFVRMSCGGRWALGCWAVTAALSLLLIPSKGGGLAYALFAGFYPVFKLWLERQGRGWLRWIGKLALFNAVFTLFFFLAKAMFFQGAALPLGPVFLYIAANLCFFAYDYALTLLILIYIRKIARRLR